MVILNAFVIFADEAVWGGDKSAEGRLKAMITEGTNTINDKGRPEIQVRNYSRIFVASMRNGVCLWVRKIVVSL
jgi:hypothetical protein